MRSLLLIIMTAVATVALPLALLAVIVGAIVHDNWVVKGSLVAVGLLIIGVSALLLRRLGKDRVAIVLEALFPWW